jgi:hypothetical protein
LATSALLLVIETAAVLPGAVVAVGQAPAWLPLAWYAVLGCWVAAGSADFRQIGIRPAALKAAALLGAGLMTILAVVGWPGDRGSGGVQVVLLDTEPAAAFVRTQAGMTALVMSSSASRGVGASVGALLDLSESSVDVELSPAGLRTAVDLLALGTSAGSRLDAVDGPEVDHDVTDAPASNPLLPGTEIELADRVRLNVVDVREASGRQVVDLAIHVEGFTILLPGPGTPSTRWKDVPPEAVSVAALPASAVSWARTLPARNWLLLVGEPAQERARGESGVPFLARREAGSVELIVLDGAVKVRTERCSTGRDCVVELPPPAIRTLLADGPVGDTSGGRRSPVQSGRIGDGR